MQDSQSQEGGTPAERRIMQVRELSPHTLPEVVQLYCQCMH